MGAARHIELMPELGPRAEVWPVPFATGIPRLRALQGTSVVVLASGDPFWFGAGSVFARAFDPLEWRCLPGPSTFTRAASKLGWPLETTGCFGLHAKPLEQIVPCLAPNAKLIVLLRDGAAVQSLADVLTNAGFGSSTLSVMEALGGPRERIRVARADDLPFPDISHPVCVGIAVAGDGAVVTLASGRADAFFDNDGQITKRPIRALALSALAPRPGEHLWDVGAGSGSIGLEWMLTDPSLRATAFETRADRSDRVRANAARWGLNLKVVQGHVPETLTDGSTPDAVFVGGGASDVLFEWLWDKLAPGTRLVAHAVTLESEALFARWHAEKGGQLLRIALSEAAPLGPRRGWSAAYPVIQWSVSI